MIKKEVQAITVVFIILALALVYVGHQTDNLRGQVGDLQERTSTIVEALHARVSELENLIIETGVTIDNGTGVTTHTVYLTRGATALEALWRVAVVKTTYYAGLGEFIDSIDGVTNDPATGKYWMWYIWYENEAAWRYATVGAGSYKLGAEENIKFSYEVPSW